MTKEEAVINDHGQVLNKDEVWELAKTEKGRKQLKLYIMRARVAMAAQNAMESLGVVPSPENQQECCQIIWDTLFSVPIEAVMEYAKQVGESLSVPDGDIVGNC